MLIRNHKMVEAANSHPHAHHLHRAKYCIFWWKEIKHHILVQIIDLKSLWHIKISTNSIKWINKLESIWYYWLPECSLISALVPLKGIHPYKGGHSHEQLVIFIYCSYHHWCLPLKLRNVIRQYIVYRIQYLQF